MDKEKALFIHNGIYAVINKDNIEELVENWVHIENIMFGAINQPHKLNYHKY